MVGSVHDSSGAVIPKANVNITDKETGTTLNTKASSSGQYVFPLVPVGTYTLSISAPGFEQVEQLVEVI